MRVLLRAARSSGLGIFWRQGADMDDNDDYELANWMHLIATCILVLFAVTGIFALAGFIWGML
jgi:hypothetical protein